MSPWATRVTPVACLSVSEKARCLLLLPGQIDPPSLLLLVVIYILLLFDHRIRPHPIFIQSGPFAAISQHVSQAFPHPILSIPFRQRGLGFQQIHIFPLRTRRRISRSMVPCTTHPSSRSTLVAFSHSIPCLSSPSRNPNPYLKASSFSQGPLPCSPRLPCMV